MPLEEALHALEARELRDRIVLALELAANAPDEATRSRARAVAQELGARLARRAAPPG
ncbi:MAG TPA: hypothetical protein VFH78_08195 [Candidatus Thermoplasmatota archaeon]|nr:hypothetical protein [Candidatus Thermoplasmatota archaeon]